MAVTFDTGPGGQLLCAFIEGLMEAVEATFTPELLGEEQYLDEEISTYLLAFPSQLLNGFEGSMMVMECEC